MEKRKDKKKKDKKRKTHRKKEEKPSWWEKMKQRGQKSNRNKSKILWGKTDGLFIMKYIVSNQKGMKDAITSWKPSFTFAYHSQLINPCIHCGRSDQQDTTKRKQIFPPLNQFWFQCRGQLDQPSVNIMLVTIIFTPSFAVPCFPINYELLWYYNIMVRRWTFFFFIYICHLKCFTIIEPKNVIYIIQSSYL